MKWAMRVLMLLGLISGGWSQAVLAYTYACEPETATANFYTNFGSYTIADTSKNSTGTIFKDAASYNSGGSTSMVCDCEKGTSLDRFFWSETSLIDDGNIDGTEFYTVNDYLQVGVSILLGGNVNAYKPLPWTALDNQRADTTGCGGDVAGDVNTGSMGILSLRIVKPFVGRSIIANAKVADIYAGRSATGSHGAQPIVSVYLSGSGYAPQSCKINSGQIVTVDFGQLFSGSFITKGQMGGTAVDKTVVVPISCTNIDAGANMTLRFQTETSPDYSDAIKTSNPDVGILIKDREGNLITPNTGTIPFNLDNNSDANVTFHLEPVSTTGTQPAAGTFHAEAYIRVDFA